MFREWIDNLGERMRDLIRPWLKQASTRVDPLIAQARGRYQKLEPRERILVQIAGALVAIFLLYNLVYMPIVDLSSGLEAKIAQRQQDLADVRRLAGTYAQLKANLANAEKRTVPLGKDFSLFFRRRSLDDQERRPRKDWLDHARLRSQAHRRFTEYSVQLKLANVNLAQLVDALYGINAWRCRLASRIFASSAAPRTRVPTTLI